MEHALEYGGVNAHLEKPTIFDVFAIQTTKSLLPPVFEQFIRFIGNRHSSSNWSRPLIRFSEELYAIFELITETASILSNSAGLCEAYYGIMRVGRSGKELDNWQKIVSILELTIIPYSLGKLVRYLEQLDRLRKRERSLLWIITGWQLGNVCTKYLYTFFKNASPSLLTLLMGIKFGRPPPGNSTWNTLTPLAALMFIIRFIQWWQENMQAQAARRLALRKTIPPPLDFPPAHPQGLPDTLAGHCPHCKSKPITPVALSTGRVFCKECLEKDLVFIKENKCPVTWKTLKEWQVRPLFIN